MHTLIRCAPFLFFASMLGSCGGGGGEEEKMVFHYNEPGGISSLDPAFSRNVENIWAVHQLFNGLVRMNSELEVVPDIAKDWERSDSGTVYTFHLRNDVRFHEHKAFPNDKVRKVTAADFEYSFERVMDEETASPGSYIFDRLREDAENGVKALDDSTLEIRLKEPFEPFLGLLTMKYCSVVPKEVIEQLGKEEFGMDPVGTGPFQFKQWEKDVKMLLVRNPHYFETDEKGRSLPYLDGIEISFLKDRHTAFMQFKKGEFDYLSGVDGSFKEEVLNEKGKLLPKHRGEFELDKGPYLKTDYLGLLVDSSMQKVQEHAISKPKVRRAMNLAIDREKIVRHLRMNVGVPARNGFIPKGMPSHGNEELPDLRHDPQRAAQLLKEAGYPNGEGISSISLVTTENYTGICEYVQYQMRELGIPVEVEVLPPSNHRDGVANSQHLFFRKSWVADYPDAQNFLSLFHSSNFSPGGPNYTHFSNARFDSLYDKAMQEPDLKERRELYRKMDRILVRKAPVLPLYYDEVLRLVKTEVKGLKSNGMNLLDLRKVRIAKEGRE